MPNTVLVTDNLFIQNEHVQALQQAGLQIERLDKPEATEEELIAALQGKVGYILGGTERVTPAVIEAVSELRAIVLPGTNWQDFIPGYAQATAKGILIANAPGANAYSVAEYTLMLILMLLRRPLELGSTGTSKFITTGSIVDARIGIIGMGRVGELVARMLVAVGATDVVYFSHQAKPQLHEELGLQFMPLEELVSTADVITAHLPNDAGEVLSEALLKTVKEGAVLVNTGSEKTYNNDGLYRLLNEGIARAAFDFPIPEARFDDLTAESWFYSNATTGFNTFEAAQVASDMAAQSLINLLTTGQDDYRVN